jgi:hypothetical protein
MARCHLLLYLEDAATWAPLPSFVSEAGSGGATRQEDSSSLTNQRQNIFGSKI